MFWKLHIVIHTLSGLNVIITLKLNTWTLTWNFSHPSFLQLYLKRQDCSWFAKYENVNLQVVFNSPLGSFSIKSPVAARKIR